VTRELALQGFPAFLQFKIPESDSMLHTSLHVQSSEIASPVLVKVPAFFEESEQGLLNALCRFHAIDYDVYVRVAAM
jgi:hypothetical protein